MSFVKLLLVFWFTSLSSCGVAIETAATDTEVCEKFCSIYNNAINTCPSKYGGIPLTNSECMAQCMSPIVNKRGTDQDFGMTFTLQCSQNHALMAIKEGKLTNSAHCRHANLDGKLRCDPSDRRAIFYDFIVRRGRIVYYSANTALSSIFRLPNVLLAIQYLLGLRGRLYTSYPNPEVIGSITDCAGQSLYRTADGTCNSLDMPMMGAVGTPFVRHLQESQPHPYGMPDAAAVADIMRRPLDGDNDPKRRAPFNQLAVGWIQFMTHDWFQHDIAMAGMPTQKNNVTHWWDGSQIYGSSAQQIASIRVTGGKILLDNNQELVYDSNKVPKTGFGQNFWVGLHVFHTLFAREHNYIVDQLARLYPAMNDDQKFGTARLIVCAELAKIHTVEWTPTLLNNTMLKFTMNANWHGMLKTAYMFFPKWMIDLAAGTLKGINAPYAGSRYKSKESMFNTSWFITEEFISVYRMHPLLPNSLTIGNRTISLRDLSFIDSRELVPISTTSTLLKVLAEAPARTLSLQNYPSDLYDLQIPGRGKINLAEIDIMRDRERKLPRYNDARRTLLLKPYESLSDLTDDQTELQLLESVYTDIEQVDLMVGSLVDKDRPQGFAFGIVPFHIFVVMASRRIFSDRFFQESFTAEHYTQFGIDYVDESNFRTILLRHFPEYASKIPQNPFMNW